MQYLYVKGQVHWASHPHAPAVGHGNAVALLPGAFGKPASPGNAHIMRLACSEAEGSGGGKTSAPALALLPSSPADPPPTRCNSIQERSNPTVLAIWDSWSRPSRPGNRGRPLSISKKRQPMTRCLSEGRCSRTAAGALEGGHKACTGWPKHCDVGITKSNTPRYWGVATPTRTGGFVQNR